MDQQEVIDLMIKSKSKDEWNDNCDKVKKACGGYPSFWGPTIMQSGLDARVAAGWGVSAEIHISNIKFGEDPLD